MRMRFADWLPVPFEVATVMTTSLTVVAACGAGIGLFFDWSVATMIGVLSRGGGRCSAYVIPASADAQVADDAYCCVSKYRYEVGRISHYPESGVRIEIVRDDAGPPWRYQGHAVMPDALHELMATIHEDGTVDIELAADAPAQLEHQVRFVILAVCGEAKHDQGEGSCPPPQRIVRWRAGDRPSRPGGLLG